MSDVHPIFKDLLTNISRTPRFRIQLEIERAITDLSPEYLEAGEILDAIEQALIHKYGGMSVELELAFRSIGEQLDEEHTVEYAEENAKQSQINDEER